MRTNLMAIMAFAVPACGAYGQDERLLVKRDPDDASRFICDVKFATFKTPKDWQASKSGKQTYAILTRADETYPNVTSMVSIDIGKPVAQSAKAVAEALAKKWGSTEAPIPQKVDGEDGFRVKVTPTGKEVRPIDCVVAIKGELAFMLIGGAKEKGSGIEKAMDELVVSWKWKE